MENIIELLPAESLKGKYLEYWKFSINQNSLLRNPFFHNDFYELLFASRKKCFFIVVRNGSEILGLLPFQLGRGNIGYPVANELVGYYGIVSSDPFCCDWNLKQIVKKVGLSGLVFDQVPMAQVPFAAYTRKIEYSPALIMKDRYIETTDYWQKSGQNTFDRMAYKLRKIGRQGSIRFEYSSHCPKLFHFFIKEKQLQYFRTGAYNVIGMKENTELLRNLFNMREKNELRFILSGLYLNNEPVAAHIGLAFKKIIYSWFPVMKSVEPGQSPGLALYSHLIPKLHEEGFSVLDFGTKPLNIKTRLMNFSFPIRRGFISA